MMLIMSMMNKQNKYLRLYTDQNQFNNIKSIQKFCHIQLPKVRVFPYWMPNFVIPEKELWLKINAKYINDGHMLKSMIGKHQSDLWKKLFRPNLCTCQRWDFCTVAWESFYIQPLHSFQRVFRFSESIRELATIFITSSEFHRSGPMPKLQKFLLCSSLPYFMIFLWLGGDTF